MKVFNYKHVEEKYSITFLEINDKIVEKKTDGWFPDFDQDLVAHQQYFVRHKTIKTLFGIAYKTEFSEEQEVYGFELDMYYCCAETPKIMEDLKEEYQLTTEIMQRNYLV